MQTQDMPEGAKDLFKMACVVSDKFGKSHPAVLAAWDALNSKDATKIDEAYTALEAMYEEVDE